MSSDCPRRRKKQLRSRCWPTRLGTGGLRTFRPPLEHVALRFWERFPMHEGPGFGYFTLIFRRLLFALLWAILLLPAISCYSKPDANTLVMIIESSPTNLDPRIGIDAQSERIDNLIFDDLLSRGEDLNVAPGLAERWEIPDSLTFIFHLHREAKFHDGRPLTSRDVKWTFDSLLQGKIRSTKAATYKFVDRIDAPDDATVIFHMKEPDATLLWNLSDGAIGIVPYA